MASHDGDLLIEDNAIRNLFRVPDPDTPGTVINLGGLPAGLATPLAMTSIYESQIRIGSATAIRGYIGTVQFSRQYIGSNRVL